MSPVQANLQLPKMRVLWPIPRSTLGLSLIGFVLVTLPLCVALLTAFAQIDDLARLSRNAAFRSSQTSQQGRVLIDGVLDMERALNEYEVLGDDSLFGSYVVRRTELRQAAEGLAALQLGAELQADIGEFLELEQALFDGHRGSSQEQVLERWRDLSARAHGLVSQSRELIAVETAKAADQATTFQRMLLIQALAVLPLSAMLAVLFARLISRPIGQIDSAIRGLASDSFHDPIEIQGPRDLQEVGACLDSLRARIAALEKEKSSFVRRISHELKTPLTTIRQGAELLADQNGTPPEESAEIGKLLRESSLELQGLIEDLLEFGKTQRPVRGALNLTQVDLKSMLQKILSEHSLVLKSKKIELRPQLEEVTLTGDITQLRTALNNIIANAVKYTPVEGRIDVRLSAHDDGAVLDVTDDGPGISEMDRRRVFEPFYQGNAATGSPVKGTGLGLAIAKDYVEAHHGNIEILPGHKGAHLRVHLPLPSARG
ncbi:MAG TPA: ATP-binding protein [Gammaproteobacteria bacterium]|jgi:two-component system sensor histidine kinase GlrK